MGGTVARTPEGFPSMTLLRNRLAVVAALVLSACAPVVAAWRNGARPAEGERLGEPT